MLPGSNQQHLPVILPPPMRLAGQVFRLFFLPKEAYILFFYNNLLQ
jgi:hypothetical protein